MLNLITLYCDEIKKLIASCVKKLCTMPRHYKNTDRRSGLSIAIAFHSS